MISLNTFDYTFLFGFFATTLFIGFYVSKQAGKNSSEFFLSGRNMPWWLLGVSMVATTFSTDTPNLVTDIVRKDGVSGNWVWWVFLITGLLTVFIYARLWRRSNVSTDIEFYEFRYGGEPARFLRAFRSIYLGIIFNILAMAAVTLAAIKIGNVMLGLSPLQTIGFAGIITIVFSAMGGFKGVVYTDFLLFFVAMAGAVGAAYFLINIPEIGGLEKMLSNPLVAEKVNIFPNLNDKQTLMTLLVIPLAVQWWSAWYPGAEPGGGGYIAQRMLAAKDENHAIGATFFFNIMHYAIRPWPWILVALASLVIYPDVASIKEAFPNVPNDKLGHDLAYSAMLSKLPNGLLGIVLTSLIAAYMSTISTHLNWGSSYIVNDFYKEYVKKDATEKQLVSVGRLSTVLLMVASAIVALLLTNAKQIFETILMFGAGTGAVFILRWFWWRINAWSEISGMFVSGTISVLLKFTFIGPYLFGNPNTGERGVMASYWEFPFVVLITSVVWLTVTFLTKPEDDTVLRAFYKKIQPGGMGWKKVIRKAKKENVVIDEGTPSNISSGITAMLLGLVIVYGALLSTGYWIYGEYIVASILTFFVVLTSIILRKLWKKVKSFIL